MADALPGSEAQAVTAPQGPAAADPLLAPLNDAFLGPLLKLASIQPGERVLILWAAAGGLIEAVAQRTGPDGEILVVGNAQAGAQVSTSKGMVPIATTSAELSELNTSHWDAAICHLGLAALPDPVATLRELHRLLRPVGRIGLSAWGLPDRVRWLGFPLDLLARRGLGFRSPERLPLFGFGVPGSLSRTLAEAGYEDVTPERVREDAQFDDFEQYWRTLRFGSRETEAPLARLAAQDLEGVRSDLKRTIERYTRRDGRILLPMEALIVAAVK